MSIHAKFAFSFFWLTAHVIWVLDYDALKLTDISVTDDTEMRFGGLISTSNIAKGEKVTVKSGSDLLWTISIKMKPIVCKCTSCP